jgi:hypothetical protein
MIYIFARIGAVVAMKVEDYYSEGQRWWLRLREKGGKRHEMPTHHKLEAFIDEYHAAAKIRDDGKGPLFRSAVGKTGVLTGKPMNRVEASRMVRRHRRCRLQGQARLPRVPRGRHHRLPEAGHTLENAQAVAAHESPRTTNSTIALTMRSRSTRSGGLRFSSSPSLRVVRRAGDAVRELHDGICGSNLAARSAKKRSLLRGDTLPPIYRVRERPALAGALQQTADESSRCK